MHVWDANRALDYRQTRVKSASVNMGLKSDTYNMIDTCKS